MDTDKPIWVSPDVKIENIRLRLKDKQSLAKAKDCLLKRRTSGNQPRAEDREREIERERREKSRELTIITTSNYRRASLEISAGENISE